MDQPMLSGVAQGLYASMGGTGEAPLYGAARWVHSVADHAGTAEHMNTARVRQNAVDALKSVTPITVRKKVVRARLAARQASAGMRTLPDFLILGGQRCGTSSMYKYLGRHPEIAPSLRKEIEYFTIDYGRGEAWYRAHFPLTARRSLARKRNRSLQTFEATPDYLFDPRAPQRAASLVPDARCIVMLRDPVERAYSHYHHNVRLGLEDLSFPDAIAAEEERLAGDRLALRSDPTDRVLNFRRFSYMSRGEYAHQIVRWFEHYPRDRFHFIMTDDFFERPEQTLHSMLAFLDLTVWSPPEFRNYSYTTGAVDNPDLSDDLREELMDRFAPHDRDLADLLGIDLPWRTGT